MNIVYSEKLIRGTGESNIFFASRNIERVFSVYAYEGGTPMKFGVVQWNGRQVVLDCTDIPDEVEVFITYFTDHHAHEADIIPMAKMVQEVYNKFGGQQYCQLSERFIQEKLIYHINYLNRTKINRYYNKQFCFSKQKSEFNCIYLQNSCCDQPMPEMPNYQGGCGCTNPTCTNDECRVDDVVELTREKRYTLPEGAPKHGMLRLATGEYVGYAELEDGLHLDSQHDICKLQDYRIGYWIPTHDILNVSVDGRKTSAYDIKDQYIFLRDDIACNVCIEYTERYSECTSDTECVQFDATFWKLPVFETLVEIATDESDDRYSFWSAQLQKMKSEYMQIVSKAEMDFDSNPKHIYDRSGRYNSRYAGAVRDGRMNMFPSNTTYVKTGCKNCK